MHFTSSDRRPSAWEGLCTTAGHRLRSSGAPGRTYPHDISRLSGNQQNDERGVPREDIPLFRTTRLDSRATVDPPKHPKSCFSALSQDRSLEYPSQGRMLGHLILLNLFSGMVTPTFQQHCLKVPVSS